MTPLPPLSVPVPVPLCDAPEVGSAWTTYNILMHTHHHTSLLSIHMNLSSRCTPSAVSVDHDEVSEWHDIMSVETQVAA